MTDAEILASPEVVVAVQNFVTVIDRLCPDRGGEAVLAIALARFAIEGRSRDAIVGLINETYPELRAFYEGVTARAASGEPS